MALTLSAKRLRVQQVPQSASAAAAVRRRPSPHRDRESDHEDRPDRAAVDRRAARGLRRHRVGRQAPLRRPRRPRPRGAPLRDRRLATRAAELHALFPAQMPGEIGHTPYDARHASWALDADRRRRRLRRRPRPLRLPRRRLRRRPRGARMVHTVHCAFDPAAYGFYEQFRDAVGYVSISDFQRTLGPPDMRWAGTVYNALPVDGWPYRERQGRLPARLRPRLRGQGLPPRDRGRAAHRPPAAHGRRRAGVVPRLLRAAHRARGRRRADRLPGRGQRRARSASCSPARAPSSSRSSGRSRSAS